MALATEDSYKGLEIDIPALGWTEVGNLSNVTVESLTKQILKNADEYIIKHGVLPSRYSMGTEPLASQEHTALLDRIKLLENSLTSINNMFGVEALKDPCDSPILVKDTFDFINNLRDSFEIGVDRPAAELGILGMLDDVYDALNVKYPQNVNEALPRLVDNDMVPAAQPTDISPEKYKIFLDEDTWYAPAGLTRGLIEPPLDLSVPFLYKNEDIGITLTHEQRNLKKGDIVRLNGGTEDMTIQGFYGDDVLVKWKTNLSLDGFTSVFHINTLTKVEPQPTKTVFNTCGLV